MENREFAEVMQRRTKQYALRIFKLVESLPRTVVALVITKQLIRAASSIGANYRAACRARSGAEFTAKLGIVIEETDECIYWLELIIEGKLLRLELVEPLLRETHELLAVMVSARKTTQRTRQ